ncbi:putative quinol monooxygenase [Pseudooceanicola sp.]|uniref:putative quinol monooxygenase n=1 Tax=Pseudooceanicola sp. TaxID=1914328 RepID=UPI003519D320
MSGKAIVVKFSCTAELIEDFITTAKNHAAKVRTEEGCLRCDVLRPDDEPNSVYLYELFKSPEALKEHAEMPYMKDFGAAIQQMVESRHRVDVTLQN